MLTSVSFKHYKDIVTKRVSLLRVKLRADIVITSKLKEEANEELVPQLLGKDLIEHPLGRWRTTVAVAEA